MIFLHRVKLRPAVTKSAAIVESVFSSGVLEESTDDAGFNGVPSGLVETEPETNGISSNVDEEEGERQIMNGEVKVSSLNRTFELMFSPFSPQKS